MAWNSLKTIIAYFRRGTVLWSDEKLTAQGLKAERGQSGTSAAHEWISRVVRKFHVLGFPRTPRVVSQLKNLVWAGTGALSPVSCLLHELKCRGWSCAGFCVGSTNCWVWGQLPGSCLCQVLEHTCTELGTSWVAVNAEQTRREVFGWVWDGRWCVGGHCRDSTEKTQLILCPVSCLDCSFPYSPGDLVPALSVLLNTKQRKFSTHLCLALLQSLTSEGWTQMLYVIRGA